MSFKFMNTKSNDQIAQEIRKQAAALNKLADSIESTSAKPKAKDEEAIPKSFPPGRPTTHSIHKLKAEQKQADARKKQLEGW